MGIEPPERPVVAAAGTGQAAVDAAAVRWYRKAAEQGDASAQFKLGVSAYVSPTREQGFRVFANGVVDELVIDYGDFTIDAVLEDLKPLPESGC